MPSGWIQTRFGSLAKGSLSAAEEECKHTYDNAHGWSEKESHHDIAENEDDDEAEAADGIEGIQGVVGQQVTDDAAGVEGWNGNHVEEDEGEVDLDQEPSEQSQGLGRGGCADEDLVLDGGDDGFPSAGHDEDQNHQHQEGEKADEEIGGGACERDEVVVECDLFEVAGDDWYRLAPAEDEASSAEADEGAEDHERGVDDGADEIDVAGWIEGDAAFEAGGVIAKAGGHPSLRALMAGEREKEDNKLIERNYQVNA